MNTPVTATLELSDSQALALAQFVKREGWAEFRSNAVDDVEARERRSAVDQLQHAQADVGYAPR